MIHISGIVDWLVRLRNRHFLMYDVGVLSLTPLLALALRTDGEPLWEEYGFSLVVVVAVFMAIKLAIFIPSMLYNRYWRYASVDEMAKITLACLAAMAVQTVVFMYVLKPSGLVTAAFPRSIPVIEGILAFIFVGGGRYVVRLAQRGQQRLQQEGDAQRVLIVGAGEAGMMIAREMQSNPHLLMKPVGYVDDDPQKQRMRMRGLNVIGTRDDISRLVRDMHIQLVVIAIPRAPGKSVREITRICRQSGVKVKVVPGFYELLDGVSVSKIRDVQVEDLLRRPVVTTDTSIVADLVSNRCVMVTGSGGSIGSELCRQLIRLEPRELVLLGHGENSIFLVENDLRRYLAERKLATTIHTVLADIRDEHRLEQVFDAYRPDIVYHAAAHKHVSLMESNVGEAVTNNIAGTQNLLRLSDRYDAERFVMISTDKAVNPTTVMGASKRVAEFLVQHAAEAYGRPYVAVRFGNVLGSRGSVVEIFRRQIERGGPITVTDADADRFFMTIPEAVQLVLQAGAMGSGGEVFVLDMGEPVKIMDLAKDLIRLSGLQEGRDLDIVVTGLRPGEKVSERLFADEEHVERTPHEKILVCRNGHMPFKKNGLQGGSFQEEVERLIHSARNGSQDTLREELTRLIAIYTPSSTESAEHHNG